MDTSSPVSQVVASAISRQSRLQSVTDSGLAWYHSFVLECGAGLFTVQVILVITIIIVVFYCLERLSGYDKATLP